MPATLRGVLVALLAVMLPASSALAQNDAACSLPGTSRTDATLNPPGGEDESAMGGPGRGLPYIVFVLDTSAHMRRFPLDLTSDEVRAAGLGCSNRLLNALTYDVNPCIDGKGQLVSYAEAKCSSTTLQPAGYGLPYRKNASGGSTDTLYAPYDQDFYKQVRADGTKYKPWLFDNTRYYIHDVGWGGDSTTVDEGSSKRPSWVKSTALDACVAAGVPLGDQTACVTCVTGSGYYLPTSRSTPPVLAGNWMNFYPPKYVIARKLLKDQFAALDQPSRSRQAMLSIVDGARERCFSANRGSQGLDAPRDGATLLDTNTQFKPPCGQFAACMHNGSLGGGRAGFDNAVNHRDTLFTNPVSPCPSGIGVPSEAPSGTASVRLEAGPDSVCRGSFYDGAGASLGPAICAPYAEALLNAGQYLGEQALFDTLFSSKPAGTWRKTALDATDSVCPSSSCTCARPTVIMLLGGDPGFDDDLPCEITGQGCSETLPVDLCGPPAAHSKLAKVARFLANTNVKPSDSYSYAPNISTHIIAFGTDNADLAAAAQAGKGRYFSARTAGELRSALNEAIEASSSVELSFSNAAISAVQTRTGSGLLVPRFTPSSRGMWDGQLYQFKMVNEDTCGCRPTTAPGPLDPCDFNQDRQCGGVFFQDADGDFIAADAAGIFRKAALVAGVFQPRATLARPVWEASAALEAKSSGAGDRSSRKVLTVLDSNGDGAFDHQDDVVPFDEAHAEQLLPYLGVGAGSFCRDLGSRLGVCLGPVQCATKVIQYVRGRDVLDENCDGSTSDERPSKLGDIFHSSPVLVDPPLRTTNVLCQLGFHNQCLVSLTATATPLEPAGAYDAWVQAQAHRDKLILVGANDGMLHAFRGGRWQRADNPDTPEVNECPSAADCTGYYDLGDGEELWAFIPPDLLPKLPKMLLGEHQYLVDGTAMVRDVWADGNGDAKKQADEFHTVAVVGERRGGNHFFALDVTQPEGPTSLPSRGFFRWMYPQPNTPAARSAGQTYADFLPSPPPIGPVRLKVGEGRPSVGTYREVPFEERWVVLLNGGYDQALLRGRTVSMVDVWNGGDGTRAASALWTFDPGSAGYPFAATPAMVGFGTNATNPNNDSNGYFFDTATLGDVGGQLWTLRFNHPDPASWAGARTLVTAGEGGTCGRQPFFQVTANTVAVKGGHLRTLVGTGDRFNLSDTNGGECSATNLVGCLRRGCTLREEVTRAVCGKTATYRREYTGTNTADSCALSLDTFNLEEGAGTECCSATVEARVDYTLECTNRDASTVTMHWQPRVTCRSTSEDVCGTAASQFVCEVDNDRPFDICSTFDRCDEPVAAPRNGFYAVKVFDDEARGRGVFDSPAAAAAYDASALTPAGLVQVDPYTPSLAAARPAQAGWYLAYGLPDPPGHVFPQSPGAFDGLALDERTATQAALLGGCAIFSTSTPASTPGICHRTLVTATTYALNVVSGGACAGLDPEVANVRLVHRQDTQAPAPPQLAVDVTPMGTVNVKLAGISRSSGSAAQTTPLSSHNELIKASYRLPVSRTLHQCRHPDGASVDEQRAVAEDTCPAR